MASGFKTLVFNTQERCISTDVNRLQRFHEKDTAELFRYLFDVVGGDDDLNAGGVISEPNTLETPLRAEIINGLMVAPQVGAANLNLFVEPGVLFALNPDGSADGSNYKFFSDDGVSSTGALVMTANASGSIRVDVVECRVDPTEEVVVDNRDIFNPVNGLFTATSVTKERAGQLEYRVRLGIPGAGYPGNVSGWLPLAVASVPTATTSNDTITFWDVRPLLNDREFVPFNLQRNLPVQNERSYFTSAPGTTLTDVTISGVFEAAFAGRRIGGKLRRGTPGVDAESVTIGPATTDNFSGSYSVGGVGSRVFVYLLFPCGLPRWARYTDATTGSRVPRSSRGIVVVSDTQPRADGAPVAAIAMPVSTGLGGLGATKVGLCWLANQVVSTGPATYSAVVADGRKVYLPGGLYGSLIPASATLVSTIWNLTSGAAFPAHAKAIYTNLLQMATTGGLFTTWSQSWSMSFPNTTTVAYFRGNGFYTADGLGNVAIPSQVWVNVREWMELPAIYPVTTIAHTVQIVQTTGFGGSGPPALLSSVLAIYGYEF